MTDEKSSNNLNDETENNDVIDLQKELERKLDEILDQLMMNK